GNRESCLWFVLPGGRTVRPVRFGRLRRRRRHGHCRTCHSTIIAGTWPGPIAGWPALAGGLGHVGALAPFLASPRRGGADFTRHVFAASAGSVRGNSASVLRSRKSASRTL